MLLNIGIDKQVQNVVQLLHKYEKTVTTAESCTGGLVSAAITSVSGSSEVFNVGLCTYANSAKIKLLGVLPEILERFGAVSREVAMQMADGARKRFDADYGLAVTGIAGPNGGTPEKPVGTVFIACSTRAASYVERMIPIKGEAPKGREEIRSEAVLKALLLLENAIRTENKE